MRNVESEEILDICIAEIRSGRLTVEECLQRRADHASLSLNACRCSRCAGAARDDPGGRDQGSDFSKRATRAATVLVSSGGEAGAALACGFESGDSPGCRKHVDRVGVGVQLAGRGALSCQTGHGEGSPGRHLPARGTSAAAPVVC